MPDSKKEAPTAAPSPPDSLEPLREAWERLGYEVGDFHRYLTEAFGHLPMASAEDFQHDLDEYFDEMQPFIMGLRKAYVAHHQARMTYHEENPSDASDQS